MLASEPEPHVSLWQRRITEVRGPASTSPAGLSSRAAENLFWVGRYAERAEGQARLLRIMLDKVKMSKLGLETSTLGEVPPSTIFTEIVGEDAVESGSTERNVKTTKPPNRTARKIKRMTIEAFQKQIEDIYYTRDAERGVPLTFTWFVEEVGELAKEIRKQPQDMERLREEFADVFAWLVTLASLLGISLEDAAKIYAEGCPKCKNTPCGC